MDSQSDDGINIKYSKVNITNSIFSNNNGDQIDLDYCVGVVSHNVFYYDMLDKHITDELVSTDGLDISGTVLRASDNSFKNFSDKGISVGEQSVIFIDRNNLNNNKSGVSIKDGSTAFLGNNVFEYNKADISAYIKKPFYSMPTIYAAHDNVNVNKIVPEDVISYMSYQKVVRLFDATTIQ
jgi:hypothetical protein